MKKIRTLKPIFKRFKPLLITLNLGILSACIGHNHNAKPDQKSSTTHGSLTPNATSQATKMPGSTRSNLVCKNAAKFAGQKIGDGHCVSFIKHCTGAPLTQFWRPGKKVLGTSIPAGTIIATFNGKRYPSKHGHHAAIYINQDESGIWVWDQWRGKPVHKRLIRIRSDDADPGNTAQAYRIVHLK